MILNVRSLTVAARCESFRRHRAALVSKRINWVAAQSAIPRAWLICGADANGSTKS
jgi:hypothetical protein